jgi:hypothetical protein
MGYTILVVAGAANVRMCVMPNAECVAFGVEWGDGGLPSPFFATPPLWAVGWGPGPGVGGPAPATYNPHNGSGAWTALWTAFIITNGFLAGQEAEAWRFFGMAPPNWSHVFVLPWYCNLPNDMKDWAKATAPDVSEAAARSIMELTGRAGAALKEALLKTTGGKAVPRSCFKMAGALGEDGVGELLALDKALRAVYDTAKANAGMGKHVCSTPHVRHCARKNRASKTPTT